VSDREGRNNVIKKIVAMNALTVKIKTPKVISACNLDGWPEDFVG
jgi:hypothetical protein